MNGNKNNKPTQEPTKTTAMAVLPTIPVVTQAPDATDDPFATDDPIAELNLEGRNVIIVRITSMTRKEVSPSVSTGNWTCA